MTFQIYFFWSLDAFVFHVDSVSVTIKIKWVNEYEAWDRSNLLLTRRRLQISTTGLIIQSICLHVPEIRTKSLGLSRSDWW